MTSKSHYLLLALLLLATPTIAADEQLDLQALRTQAEQGDFVAQRKLAYELISVADTPEKLAEVVRLTTGSAAADDPLAIILLGALHLHGRGVVQDAEQALRLFQRAAGLGSSDAWVEIGSYYSQGFGAPVDAEKALEAFRKAAEMGNPQGQANVALCYQNGIGVTADLVEALRYYRLAAAQDQPTALLNLGVMVFDGAGVEADPPAGMQLMVQAAELDFAPASYTVGALLESGSKVDQDLVAARGWYVRAAALNQPVAAYRLGKMMTEGSGGEQDIEGAFQQFLIAGQLGQVDAMYELFNAYDQGTGVAADATQARYWLNQSAQRGNLAARLRLSGELRADKKRQSVPPEKVERIQAAANNGSSAAQLQLGGMYYRGEGLDRDRDQALNWYLAAAQQGVIEAMEKLGSLLMDRKADKDEKKRAIKWLKRAAELGDAQSQYTLGMAQMRGEGTRKNEKSAIQWLRMAAEQAHKSGQVGYAFALNAGRGTRSNRSAAARWMLLRDPMGTYPPINILANHYRKGDGVPRDPVFAHFLYKLAVTLKEDERLQERLDKSSHDLSEKDLESAAQLTRAYELAQKSDRDVLRWRELYAQSRSQYFDDQYGDAASTVEDSLTLVLAVYGSAHFNVAMVIGHQARIENKLKHDAKAQRLFKQALKIVDQGTAVPIRLKLSTLKDFASYYRWSEDPLKSTDYFLSALQLAEQRYGADSHQAAGILKSFGRMLYFADQFTAAVERLERVVAIQEIGLDRGDEDAVFDSKIALADALRKSGGEAPAEVLYRQALEHYQIQGGPGAYRPLNALISLYVEQDRWGAATEIQEQLLVFFESNGTATEVIDIERALLQEFRELAQSVKQLADYQELEQSTDSTATDTPGAEAVEYESPLPVPASFDLTVHAGDDGRYEVDKKVYDLDGLLQLISQQQAINILVRFDPEEGDPILCLSVIGIDSGARIYYQSDGETTNLSIVVGRSIFDQVSELCRS